MTRRISAWILADQLTLDHPALAAAEREVGRDGVRVVLVESRESMHRLPYHRKRQVLSLSAGRHFAQELKGAGYTVDLIAAETSREGLAQHIKKHKPGRLTTMSAAEYTLRTWQLGPMTEHLGLPTEALPNSMFLLGRFNPIPNPQPGHRYVMENFYRAMRKHFQLLMEPGAAPAGGKWNLDAENRRPLPRDFHPPPVPRFPPDKITRAVIAEVDKADLGVGSTEAFDYPVTRADANSAFVDFLTHRLPDFGSYEDAMSRDEGVLHHSVLSPQMNLGLLDPLAMAQSAEAEFRAGRAPLNSVEGFIRQIIGWREFMYWQYHRQMPGLRQANAWNAHRPMPQMFWDGQTEMSCIRSVVNRLIASGYTHHIERLMIVCNFCMLAGVDPAAVADWFLTFYADSHDWVVLPNVIGMGLNADSGLTATKPYISSASYINRMSNFCDSCAFSPKLRVGPDACPFNALYWNFLLNHESTLRANPRLGPAVLGLKRIPDAERASILEQADRFLTALQPYNDGPQSSG